jgi:hypothetical protein
MKSKMLVSLLIALFVMRLRQQAKTQSKPVKQDGNRDASK